MLWSQYVAVLLHPTCSWEALQRRYINARLHKFKHKRTDTAFQPPFQKLYLTALLDAHIIYIYKYALKAHTYTYIYIRIYALRAIQLKRHLPHIKALHKWLVTSRLLPYIRWIHSAFDSNKRRTSVHSWCIKANIQKQGTQRRRRWTGTCLPNGWDEAE